MRKSIIIFAVAAILVNASGGSSALALGKKPKERTETRDYVGFGGFRGAVEGACDGEPVGCVIFPIEKGERYVSIEVTDTAGMPVWASVYVYGYVDPATPHEHVCGSSDSPLAITKGVTELVVTVTQTTGGATNPCMGPTTVGSVTATFRSAR